MARIVREEFVSDLSGEPIQDGEAWTMTLTPSDARKNKRELDISEEEAQAFLNKGREIKRRGRKPGTKVESKSGNGRRKATPDPKPA